MKLLEIKKVKFWNHTHKHTRKTCWKLDMPPSHSQNLICCEPWSRRQDLKITAHKIDEVTLNLYIGDSADLCRQVINTPHISPGSEFVSLLLCFRNKQNLNPNSRSIMKSFIGILVPVRALQIIRCLNSKTSTEPPNLSEVFSFPLVVLLPLSHYGFPCWRTSCKSGTKELVINFSLDSKSIPGTEGVWTICLSQL